MQTLKSARKPQPRKRGRPLIPTTDRKSATIAVRVTADVRERLAQSAEKTGHNLSREIQARLERSLAADATQPEFKMLFGSHHDYAVARLFNVAMRRVEEATGERWFDDQFTAHHVAAAVSRLLLTQWCHGEEEMTPPKGYTSPAGTSPDNLGERIGGYMSAVLDFAGSIKGEAAVSDFFRVMSSISQDFGLKWRR